VANYQTHVTVSGAVGLAAAVLAWRYLPGVGLVPLSLAALAGFFGGVVPDLDHDSGVAINEIGGLLASLTPLALLALTWPQAVPWGAVALGLAVGWHYGLHYLLRRLPWWQGRSGPAAMTRAWTVAAALAAAAVLLAPALPIPRLHAWLMLIGASTATLGLVGLFKVFTIHRGLFHSIPTVGIYGAALYLLAGGLLSPTERWLLAASAWAGALSHLLLDELWSVDFMGARLKKSSGTAFSFWKKDNPRLSAFAWALFALLLAAALTERSWRLWLR
jgi:hypothetical protein